jgi:hypothetical protein
MPTKIEAVTENWITRISETRNYTMEAAKPQQAINSSGTLTEKQRSTSINLRLAEANRYVALGDNADAFPLFLTLADESGSERAYMGALNILRDHQNPTRLFDLCSQDCNARSPATQLLIAECYRHGYGVPADPQKAIEFTINSAKLNFRMALSELCYRYESGDGVNVDFLEAANYQEQLGNLYWDGIGGRQEKELARECFDNVARLKGLSSSSVPREYPSSSNDCAIV